MDRIYQLNYFGFVYIWYDRRRKKFYIGSHKGSIDDGYICSSRQMLAAYKRRPETFTRKILYYEEDCSNKSLLEAERRWLSMIRDTELGKKYYNRTKGANGGVYDNRQSFSEKLTRAAKAYWASEASNKHREKLSIAAANPERVKPCSQKMKVVWSNPEYREKMKRLGHGKHKKPGNGKNQTGTKNPNHRGFFITPWGTFPTAASATLAAPTECRMSGVNKYCLHSDKVIKKAKNPYLKPFIGKTMADAGFYYVRKESSNV